MRRARGAAASRGALRVGLALAAALAAGGAAGATPVDFSTLDVYWDAGVQAKTSGEQAPILQSPKGQKQRKAIVAGLCALAADKLLIGKGAGGRGLFRTVNCIDPVAAADDGLVPTASWRLAASEAKKGKGVRLTLLFAAGPKPFEVGTADLAGVDRLGGLLADDAYKSRLARLLQDYLPADYAFPAGVKGPGAAAAKGAPKSLQLFELEVDVPSATWRPEAAGTATLQNGAWSVDGDEAALGYDTARTVERRDGDRKALASREKALVEEAEASVVGKISDLLADQVSAGYIGLRYGRVLGSAQDPLLSKVSLLSVVSEFRSGPLEGLRFYYDWIPNIKARSNGLDETFGMNRLVVGWGFGFGVPYVIDRVELVPKLGKWNFRANIPVATDDGPEIRPFELKSGVTFGAELALEKFASSYLVRAWASRDFSKSFLKVLSSDVTSTRAGLDALIGGPRLPFLGVDFKLAFLLFAVNDHFAIIGKRAADQGGGDYRITIDAPFAGAGLAITW